MGDTPATTIRVRRLDGNWVTLGTDNTPGVVPESVSMSSDEHGSQALSFVMRRDDTIPWGDLQAGAQVMVDVAGIPVWGGRINQTPSTGGGGSEINVGAQGWQYHLDDDPVNQGWVSAGARGWKDSRAFYGSTASLPVAGEVVVEESTGSVIVGFPKGVGLDAQNGVAVTFDAGPGRTVEVVTFDYTIVGKNLSLACFTRHHPTDNCLGTGTLDTTWNATVTNTLANSGSVVSNAGSGAGMRYFTLLLWNPSGSTYLTTTAHNAFTFRNINVFASGTYRSGSTSILTASQVVTAVATSENTPFIQGDTSLIDPSTFTIPDLWPDGFMTGRALIDGVNAYHDYTWGVTPDRRVWFNQRPTTPAYELQRSAGNFGDASLGNLDALYNKVNVQYVDQTGTPAVETVTADANILTRQGITKTMVVDSPAAITQPAAQLLGETWLARRTTAPLQGSVTVMPGELKAVDGTAVHPSVLLTAVGKLIRLNDRVDPASGAVGRNGTIVAVSYQADTQSATVTLDNNNVSLEAWLSRLALLQGK